MVLWSSPMTSEIVLEGIGDNCSNAVRLNYEVTSSDMLSQENENNLRP